MNIIGSMFRFVYRIRYWLLIGPILVATLAIYYTSSIAKKYEATTTIYTGITSSPNIDGKGGLDWNATNNAFDNIMNLVRSRSTLERVSIRLLAMAMMKGDPKKDNQYIKASNYNHINNLVPKDVKRLIDKNDEESTVQNLMSYKKEDKDNFLFGLFNWFEAHYSFRALSDISVARLGTSDMIELKYSSDDPGLAHQTLIILNEELISEYSNLQMGSSNSVIEYFENQLEIIRAQLGIQEDSLMLYSMSGKIINYDEQTKRLTEVSSDLDNKYEQAVMDFYTSKKLIDNLEAQLDERANLMKENKDFIHTMDEISLLTRKITEIETFNEENTTENLDNLPRYKLLLQKSEQKLYDITNKINDIQFSKEGLSMDNIVQQWLTNVLQNEKSKAEIGALKDRKKDIESEYMRFTPIGPNLKKQEREISISEESYHMILNHLASARLQQKNIQMSSATLKVVAAPIYPLAPAGTQRRLIIIVAFIGSLFFILGNFLILELLDKTVRDKDRAKRLTKGVVLGAFPGNLNLSHRGYAKEHNRIASAYACNMLQNYFLTHGTTYINLISIEAREGRSFIAESLKEYWEEKGLFVQIVSYETDFDPESRKFLMGENLADLYKPASKIQPDIVLVEYPPLRQCNTPKAFIQQAQVNLFIIKATRAWKGSDQLIFDKITSQADKSPVLIFLNFAQRFAVEDFTGQLPPYTRLRKRLYELLNLGLTAERSKNIE